MASIGFLGCGKIGKAMIRHIQTRKDRSIAFVQDPFFQNDCELDCRVVPQLDETVCKADPAVHTNSHDICVEGEGVSFRLAISTFASGGVTGSYTPISACGSLDRILKGEQFYQFV